MRRLVLSLLMLAVLLPSAAFARAAYLCSIDGRLRSACCCPTKATQPKSAPVSTIKPAWCCEVSTVTPTKTAAVEQPKTRIAAPDLVAIPVSAPVALLTRQVATCAHDAHAPPDTPSRSLFASHCSLLL